MAPFFEITHLQPHRVCSSVVKILLVDLFVTLLQMIDAIWFVIVCLVEKALRISLHAMLSRHTSLVNREANYM